MRRRRRGSRFTWMPMLGSQFTTDTPASTFNANVLLGVVQPTAVNSRTDLGALSTFVTALVPDATFEPTPGVQSPGVSLADYTQGQDWFLRRIVGKIALRCTAQNATLDDQIAWPSVLVTAGFFVGPSNEELGNAAPELGTVETDPARLENIRQPWIWRRTWWLGSAETPAAAGGVFPQYSATLANSNQEFGSLGDGPNVDAKTMRRIRRNERLWLSITAFGIRTLGGDGNNSVTGTDEQQPIVDMVIDLRCLGGMRRSNNKSTFG